MLKISRRGGVLGLASLIVMCHVIWFAGGERKKLVALTMIVSCDTPYNYFPLLTNEKLLLRKVYDNPIA